ncbi:MAG: protease inhibitor I42 family protein [Chloroflexi bacterium]|nr:protease inhibitor I42 family protein [Chloroflexota bacterium]
MRTHKPTRTWLVLVLLAMALPLAGCDRPLELADADEGGRAELEVGDRAVIKRQSSPTTGYGWEVLGLDDQDVITLVDRSYKADSPLIGSGGVDTFLLEASHPGEVALQLVYRRAWEQDVPPLRTYSITLVVREPAR